MNKKLTNLLIGVSILGLTNLGVTQQVQAGCGYEATFYGDEYNGGVTTSGKIFQQWGPPTAASNRHRLGSHVTVTYKSRSVTVKITDRIGYGSDIDLNKTAFTQLAPLSRGRINVCIYR